jgi:hypothetical protein
MNVPRTKLFLLLIFASALSSFSGCGGSSNQSTPPPTTSNPVPALTALSPTSSTAGAGDVTVTATGTNFISQSVVQWNGSALVTTFASGSSLQAVVPKAKLATAGTGKLTVMNPAPGGGTSSALVFTVNAPANPVPAITALAPSSAVAGGAAFTLTVTGTGFVADSEVMWNGSPRSTTYGSSTQLSASIDAADVASAGAASITVANPTPGGTSNSVSFPIQKSSANLTILNVEGSGLAWDKSQQKIYVSVPSEATANGNTITTVDPVAGSVVGSQASGAEPHVLAISDDDQYLYAALDNDHSVQRFKLPGLVPDIQFKMGTAPIFDSQLTPADLKVKPGASHTIAVATKVADPSSTSEDGVVIYDDAVARATSAGSAGIFFDSLQWKADGTQIYVEDNSSSDTQFYTMGVSSTGTETVTTYGNAFHFLGTHLQYDPTTNYVYSDQGEVLNAATGLAVGNYAAPRAPQGVVLTAVDPTLQRVFFLTAADPFSSGSSSFQLEVYDQKHFTHLESLTIPNAVGTPQSFIRWGNSGLAFVTNTLNSFGVHTAGKLYVLDGAFVNPSSPLDTEAGAPMNPTPTLNVMNPLAAAVQSGGVNITLTGVDFTNGSTAMWNGTPLTTTVVSPTQLTVEVPAGNLTKTTRAAITVTNGEQGAATSNTLYFAVNAAVSPGNTIYIYPTGGLDLAWNTSQRKLYVSMPSVQGILGNQIAVVDPASGKITTSPFVGSDPTKLSISDDAQFLYVGMDGVGAVKRLILPDFQSDIQWQLGADSFLGPYTALDLHAAPGHPHTTGVTLSVCCAISPDAQGVVIFDDGVARPTMTHPYQRSYYSIQWSADASLLYASEESTPTGLSLLAVNGSGVSLSKYFANALQNGVTSDLTIHYDAGTGYVYADSGLVVNPVDGTLLGKLNATGIAAPDSSTNQVFMLGQTAAQSGTNDYTIESFDQKKYTPNSSIAVTNVVGTPTAFIRWGTNGLAFTTILPPPYTGARNSGPGLLYVIQGSFVSGSAAGASAVRIMPGQNVHETWRAGSHTSSKLHAFQARTTE